MKRLQKPRSFGVMNGRTKDWWIKMLTEDITDTIWKKNPFCMEKITFFELVEILRPMVSADTNSPNYRSLSTDKKICSCFVLLERHGIVVNNCKYMRHSPIHCFKNYYWSFKCYKIYHGVTVSTFFKECE